MNMETTNTRTGIKFLVKIIRQGDRYGRNDCLTHDEKTPLVEFHDTRYNQFCSRYYLTTLLRQDHWTAGKPSLAVTGLTLHGGIPEWHIDAAGMKPVVEWLEQIAQENA
jgi:hypothetical protein